MKRRSFLEAGGLATAATILPSSVFGQNAASKQVSFGFGGTGGMGGANIGRVAWAQEQEFPVRGGVHPQRRFGQGPADQGSDPGQQQAHRLYKSDKHMGNFLDCIRSRERCVSDLSIGHRTTTICNLGNIAMQLKRKLTWDPAKEAFADDVQANRLLQRPMRAPGRLV